MPPITNPDILPGVTVRIADNQLRVSPSQVGPKVTVMGTTTSVALEIGEPVSIIDPTADIRRLQHIDGSPSELSMAVAELLRIGALSIEVVKVGTTGLTGPAVTANQRFDMFEAAYSTLRYQDVDFVVPICAVDQTGLSGTSPAGRDRTMGYHRQLGNFCFQATKLWNSCYGIIGVRNLNKVARDEAWTGAPTTDAEELFDDPPTSHVLEWVHHLRIETGALHNHTAETALLGFIAGSIQTAPGQISGDYDLWALEEDGSAAVDRYGESVDGGAYFAVTAMLARIRTQETQNLANSYNIPDQRTQHVMCAGAVAYATNNTLIAGPAIVTGTVASSAYRFWVTGNSYFAGNVTLLERPFHPATFVSLARQRSALLPRCPAHREKPGRRTATPNLTLTPLTLAA